MSHWKCRVQLGSRSPCPAPVGQSWSSERGGIPTGTRPLWAQETTSQRLSRPPRQARQWRTSLSTAGLLSFASEKQGVRTSVFPQPHIFLISTSLIPLALPLESEMERFCLLSFEFPEVCVLVSRKSLISILTSAPSSEPAKGAWEVGHQHSLGTIGPFYNIQVCLPFQTHGSWSLGGRAHLTEQSVRERTEGSPNKRAQLQGPGSTADQRSTPDSIYRTRKVKHVPHQKAKRYSQLSKETLRSWLSRPGRGVRGQEVRLSAARPPLPPVNVRTPLSSVHLRLTLLSVLLSNDSPVGPAVSPALKLQVIRKECPLRWATTTEAQRTRIPYFTDEEEWLFTRL